MIYAIILPMETADFYIVQLEPEVDPERIKFGIAKSAQARFNSYRVTHFEAILLDSWMIRREDEHMTIETLTAPDDCEHIRGEVYDCFDIPALLERARAISPGRDIPKLRPVDPYQVHIDRAIALSHYRHKLSVNGEAKVLSRNEQAELVKNMTLDDKCKYLKEIGLWP